MTCLSKRQAVSCLAGMVLVGVPGVVQSGAWPQAPKAQNNSKLTFRALTPFLVCPAGSNVILPSPDSKAALIQHQKTEPPPGNRQAPGDAMSGPGAGKDGGETITQLLLVAPNRDQAPVVWRGGGSPSVGYTTPVSIEWLPGTEKAVVQVMAFLGPMPLPGREPMKAPQMRASLLLISGDTGTVRTIAPEISSSTYLMVSGDKPLAVLVDSKAGTVQRLENDKLGPLMPIKTLKKQARLAWYRMQPDNRTIVGAELEKGKDDTNRPRVVFQVDTVTGKLTVVRKPESAETMRFEPVRPPAQPKLPFTVVRESETVTRDGTATEVHPLWLEGRGKQGMGRVPIAPNSDEEQEPILLESAVLYKNKGAVYAVPIRKSDTS